MVVGSIYWNTDRAKRKEFKGVLGEKKAKEKREAWIRELEARDLEDREIVAKREAERERRRRMKEAGMAKCVVERSEARRVGVLSAVRELMGK